MKRQIAAWTVVLGACLAAGAEAQLFGKGWTGGAALPATTGIGVTLYGQEQDYDLVSLDVSLPFVDLGDVSGIEVENRLQEANAKLDVWVLPFLNVFGIVGNVDGKTTVDLSAVDIGVPLGKVVVDYDGLVWGGGITLAAGGERFFGSLTAILTTTDLDTTTSQVDATVISPRFGLRSGPGNYWMGLTYQKAEESHEGEISIAPLGDVGFIVELEERNALNFQVGASVDVREHWNLELEGGFGKRQHASVSFTYRF